jgi:hypothetical protein
LDAADEIAREFERRTRPGRVSPQMAITGEGIVLGPGTRLARVETDARNRSRLVLDPRGAAAILCTVWSNRLVRIFSARCDGRWSCGTRASLRWRNSI